MANSLFNFPSSIEAGLEALSPDAKQWLAVRTAQRALSLAGIDGRPVPLDNIFESAFETVFCLSLSQFGLQFDPHLEIARRTTDALEAQKQHAGIVTCPFGAIIAATRVMERPGSPCSTASLKEAQLMLLMSYLYAKETNGPEIVWADDGYDLAGRMDRRDEDCFLDEIALAHNQWTLRMQPSLWRFADVPPGLMATIEDLRASLDASSGLWAQWRRWLDRLLVGGVETALPDGDRTSMPSRG